MGKATMKRPPMPRMLRRQTEKVVTLIRGGGRCPWRIRKFSHNRIGPGSPAGAAPCRARPGPVALVPIAA
jgi:hypothetical protein